MNAQLDEMPADLESAEKLSRNLMAQRRFKDRKASIDAYLDAATSRIDWDRRREAEKSIQTWVETYCIGLLLDDLPPKRGRIVLQQMHDALLSHRNYMICMPRGSGKSSYVECTVLHALATGLQKFIVAVANNQRAAIGLLSDLWRAIIEPDTLFANDYPDVCLPFQLCAGSMKRRQLYRMQTTDLKKSVDTLQLAKIVRDGKPAPSSGSIVTCRGVSSGLRGMKCGTQRPTCIILDDLQTAETADSQEQVAKLLDVIRKDIMNLGGKQRLSVLQTATPIQPEDLVDQLKRDLSWKTTTFKAIESFPDDLSRGEKDSLWSKYFSLFDSETLAGTSHAGSLEMYKQNRVEMDAGASVFNPSAFCEADGHVSTLQKLLEIRHSIGVAAFQAEYQMEPMKHKFKLEIAPAIVAAKVCNTKMLDVPDGCSLVAAAVDLNTSYAATIAIVAFKPDTSSTVIWHDTFPCHIDQKLPEAGYQTATIQLLTSVCQHIASLGVKLDGVAIDAGGRNFDAVTSFTKTCSQLPTCAFIGRSSSQFNSLVRSRLRDAIGKTVLCGDQLEHLKRGAGKKYVFFDADFYKESVQRALVAQGQAIGSCQLYLASLDEHREFAMQVCNEQLMSIDKKFGKDVYKWISKDPHDYLDCMSMCYAVAAANGLSSSVVTQRQQSILAHRRRGAIKPRVRVV